MSRNQKSPKFYRRFIRLGNDVIASPRFTRKSDADRWYDEIKRKKQFLGAGLTMPKSKKGLRFIDFAREYMKERMDHMPRSTWESDEQRMRDYILPIFSELTIESISGSQCRELLKKISEPGYKKEGFSISKSTRDRVQALLSSVFKSAYQKELIQTNPMFSLKVDQHEKRKGGTKTPDALAGEAECLKLLKSAGEISPLHYAITATFLMSGVRKQELIALRWKCLNEKDHSLRVFEKYQQAGNQILPGTKAGENAERVIPIPGALIEILRDYKKVSKHNKPEDFIFCDKTGAFYYGRDIYNFIDKAAQRAKLTISPHGLRHTFGREFQSRSGNLKALQEMMGHSTTKTTEIYSTMSGERLKPFAEVVSFKPSKRSIKAK